MIEPIEHRDGQALRLTPNRSLSWRGNLIIMGIVAVMVALIATAWSLMGAWVILPFAGLEVTAVAIGLYLTSRKCYRQEILILSEKSLRLEKGVNTKQQEWTLPRASSRLLIEHPRMGWKPPRFTLQYTQTRVQVGAFLTYEDKRLLQQYLEQQALHIEERHDTDLIWWSED